MRAVLDEFRPGRRIYLPGATGEPLGLAAALRAEPERMRGVHLVSCPLPGMNETDYAALHPQARMTVFLPGPYLRASFAAGQIDVPPLSYSRIGSLIAAGPAFDVAIAQVSLPGPGQKCSFGIAADFSPLAWRNARRRIAIINPAMPFMKRGPMLDLAEADGVVTQEAPLICAPGFRSNTQLGAIAARIAELVPDGAAIQLGIGGAPAMLWRQLINHRDITIASGMVAEDALLLTQAGALRAGATHRAGIAYGSMEFYHGLAQSGLVEFATTRETHDFSGLSGLKKFTSVNAAVEVDLFGQINSEWRGGQLISGAGGAADFARAAIASPDGRSIIALPATAKNGEGTVSRIVAKLDYPPSIARADSDTIVTEFGTAELQGRSLEARAEALIGIAAPEHRDALAESWRAMRRNF